jgi:Ca-activated chloride channel homolog
VIARRLINTGQRVPASIVRTWEFLNYYDFAFEPASPSMVRIIPQLSSCPTNGELALQVALQSEARSPSARRAINLTFVLDTSGSMDGTPIKLLRAAVLAVSKQLRKGDIVSMVTWNTQQNELLSAHPVSGPDDPKLSSIASGLSANGGTNLHAGLVKGYELAKQSYKPDRINRLLLISDGIANVGITDENLIGQYADDEEGQEGIYLSGVGVGDGVNDTLMNTVTDAGRGAYVYLDSVEEAEKMLGERFLQIVDLAARAVRLEVTLPWYMQVHKFHGEQISTDPTKVRPQHLGPNDAMLFFQVLKACDARLIHGDDRIRIRATWETPYSREPRQAVIDTMMNALAGDDAKLTKAAAIAGWAEALAAVDRTADPAARKALLDRALGNVLTAESASTDPDLIEIAELIGKYAKLF